MYVCICQSLFEIMHFNFILPLTPWSPSSLFISYFLTKTSDLPCVHYEPVPLFIWNHETLFGGGR
jgi:hypothetical protein